MCEQVKRTNPNELERCYAVFVSNVGRTVPLWRQKVGRGDDKVVIWVNELNYFLGTCPFPPSDDGQDDTKTGRTRT